MTDLNVVTTGEVKVAAKVKTEVVVDAIQILGYASVPDPDRQVSAGRAFLCEAIIDIDIDALPGRVSLNSKGVVEVFRPSDLRSLEPYMGNDLRKLQVVRIIHVAPKDRAVCPAGYIGYVLSDGTGRLFPRQMPQGWTTGNMVPRLRSLVA